MYLLGVDGGGTGCRVRLAAADGTVLGEVSGGPANIVSNPDQARANILAAADTLLAPVLGRSVMDAEASLPVCAVLGVAGGGVPAAADALRERVPFTTVRVVNDGIAAIRGALRGGDGILAAIGTGSIFAVQRQGVIRQVGGWGFYVMGDEGGGSWLGRHAVLRALKAIDGFHLITPFLCDILEHGGGAQAIVRNAPSTRPDEFAALVPLILAAARAGDPAAEAVLAAGVAEVRAAIALLQQGGEVPVVFLGGLGVTYAKALAGEWPQAEPLGSALDGAMWMAAEDLAAHG
ncbi:BadF/BadG/BcrA/BcrD ATPase family protein [Pannonibacter sp. Q-1]